MPAYTVRYLYHSSFLLETASHYLIFDYYRNSPHGRGLNSGVIDPAALTGKPVLVFASHSHGDHYDPVIFRWRGQLPGIQYILSSDIAAPAAADTHFIGPDALLQVGGAAVRTLPSTDLGVAFVIEVDGLRIYHAGDLNWWHWEGEPDSDNRDMARAYCAQIDRLQGEHFDVAFVPLDPRLGQSGYLLGLDYFAAHTGAAVIFPMHFGSDRRVFDWLAQDHRADDYRPRVARIEHRGQQFSGPLSR